VLQGALNQTAAAAAAELLAVLKMTLINITDE